MKEFRFSLEKYSGSKSRFYCPTCNKKEFTRYIDNEIKDYIEESVGKCNRLERCGYHKTPKDFFKESGQKPALISGDKSRVITERPTFFCDEHLLLESLHSENHTSHLFDFFLQYFEINKVEKVFQKYLVGVSNCWERSTIFWQIDQSKKIRCGKIMQYNSRSGRRDKFKFKWIRNSDDTTEMRQVFFGVHLIGYFKNYKIGIVESEKTALLCDLFFDEKIIWISSGGLQGISEKKFKDLIGKEVILFPDLSAKDSKNPAIELWTNQAKIIGKKLRIDIKINNYLEFFANEVERENQYDLADFIIKTIDMKC